MEKKKDHLLILFVLGLFIFSIQAAPLFSQNKEQDGDSAASSVQESIQHMIDAAEIRMDQLKRMNAHKYFPSDFETLTAGIAEAIEWLENGDVSTAEQSAAVIIEELEHIKESLKNRLDHISRLIQNAESYIADLELLGAGKKEPDYYDQIVTDYEMGISALAQYRLMDSLLYLDNAVVNGWDLLQELLMEAEE